MIWFFGTCFLWGVYLPIVYVLRLILFFIPKVQERILFEKKNKTEVGARSFRLDHLEADLCFEFSSEGEYQQVASLIDDALEMGKRLELVFFSPSVEKTILDLYSRFPAQIRYLRYPILGLSFSLWISSDQLVLVRYDLFPEFLIWSLKRGRSLKFLWVTFKKERIKGLGVSFYKKAFLKQSHLIVYASETDLKMGRMISKNSISYDFRMEQIRRRLTHKKEKFSRLFTQYLEFKSFLEKFPRDKRLIFGNVWPEDLFLLKNIPPDFLIVIVPHQLTEGNIKLMIEHLSQIGRMPSIISDGIFSLPHNNIILFNMKGLLCELYADFGKAYVGGGFGESVHSILEPLVAGCDQLSCGPVNYRSTEFDLAKFYGDLKEVNTNQEFITWLMTNASTVTNHDRLESQIASYARYRKEIISC
jgi:3-deoxy-D-manno-octulosonic-acid transferase